MDNEKVINKLKIYQKLLSKHMKFDEMIPFGSHARGNANEDSDVDVGTVSNGYENDIFSKVQQ
jgi:predicted nucleotidyltransferase